MIVTADHGNADEMYELPKTASRSPALKAASAEDEPRWAGAVPRLRAATRSRSIRASAAGLGNLAATLSPCRFAAPPDYLPSIWVGPRERPPQHSPHSR
jgi:hypothetical protein